MAANRFETLATWYLRFNGYLTTPGFTIHPDFRKQPGGTDADVLAVRFPHSEEYQRRFNFRRDDVLIRPDRTDFVICEVKSGPCGLNLKTWRDPTRENVEYAIRWLGFEPDNACIRSIAAKVYDEGECDLPEKRLCVRFLCFGSEENPALSKQLPRARQVCHPHVFEFLRERFSLDCYNITRENWDPEIIEFANRCRRSSDEDLMDWARRAPQQG